MRPSRRRVLELTTTVLGAATCCRRAAKFGVSPTINASGDAPVLIRSPTTTNPVAIPMRTWTGIGTSARESEALRSRMIVRAAWTARSGSSSFALGQPKQVSAPSPW